jgi:DMSO/TMAO reductase YedYZ heme-binding membrane subunit
VSCITALSGAVWHVVSYFMHRYLKYGVLPWEYLLHPVNIPGVVALIIFFAMALTSSNYAMRTMTYPKWKSLQRTVYIAEGCVFLHMTLQFDKTFIWGFAIFIPLFIIQRLRLQS